jgi:hypothetical protein
LLQQVQPGQAQLSPQLQVDPHGQPQPAFALQLPLVHCELEPVAATPPTAKAATNANEEMNFVIMKLLLQDLGKKKHRLNKHKTKTRFVAESNDPRTMEYSMRNIGRCFACR